MRGDINGPDLHRQIKTLTKDLRRIDRREIPRAQARVLNTIGRKAKTRVLREVAKDLGIRNKDLRYTSQKTETSKGKERIRLTRATTAQNEVVMRGSGAGIPLIKLRARQTKSGVKAGGQIIAGAFIATASNSPKGSTKGRGNMPGSFAGKQQVFKRRGKGRYPIAAQFKSVRTKLKDGMNKHVEHVMRTEGGTLMVKELEYRIARNTSFK